MNSLNKQKEYFHPIITRSTGRSSFGNYTDLNNAIDAIFGAENSWTRVRHFAYDPTPNQLTAAMDVPAGMRIIARWEHQPGVWAAIAVNNSPINEMRLAAAEAALAVENFGKAVGEAFRKDHNK